MTLEIVSIVVGVVALVVTVLGFLAAVWFYKDGVKLQNEARNVLSQISEKVIAIQTQVGGLFEKTLNAAIGVQVLDESRDELDQQLDESGAALTSASDHSDEEWKRLVDDQIRLIRDRVDEYHETAEEFARVSPSLRYPQSQLQAGIVSALEGGPMTTKELALELGMSRTAVSRAARRLMERGLLESESMEGGVITYRLVAGQ